MQRDTRGEATDTGRYRWMGKARRKKRFEKKKILHTDDHELRIRDVKTEKKKKKTSFASKRTLFFIVSPLLMQTSGGASGCPWRGVGDGTCPEIQLTLPTGST